MSQTITHRERSAHEADLPLQPRWITWRSVIIGSLAVMLVCGLTPFNDFVVANTYFVGSYLPVAMVLVFFLLVVVINAPLLCLAPRWALAPGELAVILTMLLVSCSIPSQGLMRSFIPMLVAPFHYAGQDEQFRKALVGMNLPKGLFPVENIAEGQNSWVVKFFYTRVPEGETPPYAAWVGPLLLWGIFIAAMWAVLVSLAMMLRAQWAQNERLPFPLAQLQANLIEAPRPGKALNDLFRSRSFWIALLAVFLLQSMVALNRYFPKQIPRIVLTYDMNDVMPDPPLSYISGYIKRATLYFTFVGVMYFVQTRVAFSLWFIYLFNDAISVHRRMMGSEMTYAASQDQHLGACVAFTIGMLWVGRHHLARILRHTFAGRRAGERPPEYGSYRMAFLVAVAGLGVMVAWLIVAGVLWWLALVMVAIIILAHLVTARIVAETGLSLVRANPTAPQIYTLWPASTFTGRDIFFGGVSTSLGAYTTRESLLAYTMQGMWVTDSTSAPPRHRRGLLLLIGWSLVLGFVVCSASSLACYYHYTTPLAHNNTATLNSHGTEVMPSRDIVKPVNDFSNGRFAPIKHDPYTHFGIGVGVSSLLQAASLRWASWPLMPIGYIVSATWFINPIWYSILVGWLVKLLIVKFGGARLYTQAKPAMVGIIFGEAMGAVVWLIITLILAAMGLEYQAVNFMPA